MSIHKVTNIFVGNGTALEANVTTLTPGKIGVFTERNDPLTTEVYSAGQSIATTRTAKLFLSQTFSDRTFKKSMHIDGRSVDTAHSEKYQPATREVWAIGFNRKTALGDITVNNSTEYQFTIKFKNDKTFYSERNEVLRVSFTSAASATKLGIATQIASGINNSAFSSQLSAIVIGNGTGALNLTGATIFGVEITAKNIEQFATSAYTENRVAFDVFVDDLIGMGATTCTQIVANDPGLGTFNTIFNKEKYEYQYEGLSNRTLFPNNVVKTNADAAGRISSTVTTVTVGIGADRAVFASTALLQDGDLVILNGIAHEIKYIINATDAILVQVAPAAITGNATVNAFYSVIVITFTDTTFTSGADVLSAAKKVIYIATPAINAAGAITTPSTEGAALISSLNGWLATTPARPVLSSI